MGVIGGDSGVRIEKVSSGWNLWVLDVLVGPVRSEGGDFSGSGTGLVPGETRLDRDTGGSGKSPEWNPMGVRVPVGEEWGSRTLGVSQGTSSDQGVCVVGLGLGLTW